MRRCILPLLLMVVFLGVAVPVWIQWLAPPAVRAQMNRPRPTATVSSATTKASPLNLTVQTETNPDELKAQQDLVVVTGRLVKATCYLVVVGVLQALVFFGTLWVIKRQGDITQTQLRPWIAVENIWLENPHNLPKNLPIFLPTNLGETSLLFLKITTTNTGETVGMRVVIPPAKVVAVDVEVPGVLSPQQDPKQFNENLNRINEANNLARTAALGQAKEEFCKNYGSLPATPGGWLFFPKQSRTDDLTAAGELRELINKSRSFEIYLLGAVNYESPLAPGTFCQTGFVHQLVNRISKDNVERTFTAVPTRALALEFESAWYGVWAK